MKGPKQNDQRRLMMMHEPIPKVVFKMAVPTIVAFLITSIYSLADTYFVSGLSTQATAAVCWLWAQTVLSPDCWVRAMTKRPAACCPPLFSWRWA